MLKHQVLKALTIWQNIGRKIFLLYNLHTLLSFRFIRICYLFEREGQQFLHGQWLAHGSKTLLQEAAHSNGLFLMNTCDDVPLASIVQKCNLYWLSADSTEPPEDALNRFFCR
jgi:DNA (cytosine-5)-methyltransferase 1